MYICRKMPCNCLKYYSKNTPKAPLPKNIPSLPVKKSVIGNNKINSSFTTNKSIIPGFKRPH
jgi:hypothetical protein